MKLFFTFLIGFAGLFLSSASFAANSCEDLFSYSIKVHTSERVAQAVREGAHGPSFIMNTGHEQLYPGTYLLLDDYLPETGIPSWGISAVAAARLNLIHDEYNVKLVLADAFTKFYFEDDGSLSAQSNLHAMVHFEPIDSLHTEKGDLALQISPRTDMPIIEHEIQHIEDIRNGLREKLNFNYAAKPEMELIFILLLEIRALTVESEAHNYYEVKYSTDESIDVYLSQYVDHARGVFTSLGPETRQKVAKRLIDNLDDVPHNHFRDVAIRAIRNLAK